MNTLVKAICLVAVAGAFQARASCRSVSVFIQFPELFIWKDFGHAGISVEDKYFDFGPYEQKAAALWIKGTTIGTPGNGYFERMDDVRNNHESATAEDVRSYLINPKSDPNKSGNKAYELKIQVMPETADRIEKYWDHLHPTGVYPRFSMLGHQCTSEVYHSLRYAGLLRRGFASKIPTHFFKRLKRELFSNCGQQYNQPAKVIQLHE